MKMLTFLDQKVQSYQYRQRVVQQSPHRACFLFKICYSIPHGKNSSRNQEKSKRKQRSILRRFSRKVQEGGIIQKVKSKRYNE